jgi:hypothetical protein
VEEKESIKEDGLRPWNSIWFLRNHLRQKWTNDVKRDSISSMERKDTMLPSIIRNIIKIKDLGSNMLIPLDEVVIITQENPRWRLV